MKQFFQHFRAGTTESVNAGQETASTLAASAIETDLLDARNTRPTHQDATLSLLTVTIGANSLDGNAIWKVVFGATGGTDGNLSVTFATTDNNTTLTDDSNTDDITTTSIVSFADNTNAATTGSITWIRCGAVYEPDSGATTLIGSNAAATTGIAANETTYLQCNGFRQSNSTENYTKQIVSSAGTWKNLAVGLAVATTSNIDVTISSRINGVDGNQTVTFSEADTTAVLEDTSNTDSVSSGDLINWKLVSTNYSGSGTHNIEWTGSQIDHTSDETLLLVGGTRDILSSGTTEYLPLSGQIAFTPTEANAQHTARIAATASHLGGYSSQAAGADCVLTLRINGSDGNGTATIDTSVASSAIDTSNTDDFIATDSLTLEGTSPASPSGNVRIQSTTLKLSPTAASYTLTADSGSFALAGTTAGTLWAHLASAASGSYTLSGTAATLSQTKAQLADPASYVLTGQAVTTTTSGLDTGFVLAGTGANNTGIGSVAWVNPGNITADDGTNATATLASDERTNYLVGSNFGFTIPTEATITGIEFRVQADDSAAVATFSSVRSVKGGAVGANNGAAGESLTATPTNYDFGGAGDLWSETWAPADINASNFGVAVSITSNFAASLSADAIWAKVFYTDSGLETLTADPGSFTLTGAAITSYRDLIIAAAAGAYSLAGTDVTFPLGIVMAADSGTYVLTGQNVATGNDVILGVESGAFTLSGTTLSTLVGHVTPAATGAFTLTGTDVTFELTSATFPTLAAASGTFTLTGAAAALKSSFWTDVNTGGREIWS